MLFAWLGQQQQQINVCFHVNSTESCTCWLKICVVSVNSGTQCLTMMRRVQKIPGICNPRVDWFDQASDTFLWEPVKFHKQCIQGGMMLNWYNSTNIRHYYTYSATTRTNTTAPFTVTLHYREMQPITDMSWLNTLRLSYPTTAMYCRSCRKMKIKTLKSEIPLSKLPTMTLICWTEY